jgi:hypothetical protein
MKNPYIYYGLAVLMGLLIPLVPRMLQLRVAVLRKFHWNWFADFHERHMAGLIWFVRAILLVLALLLIWVAAQSGAATA